MTAHTYMLQSKGGEGYMKSNRRHVNRLIEAGQAEWVGVDGDEESNSVTYYADRIV